MTTCFSHVECLSVLQFILTRKTGKLVWKTDCRLPNTGWDETKKRVLLFHHAREEVNDLDTLLDIANDYAIALDAQVYKLFHT